MSSALASDSPGPATLDWPAQPDAKSHARRLGTLSATRPLPQPHRQSPSSTQDDGNAAAYWEYFLRFRDDDSKILAVAILGTGLGGGLVVGGNSLGGTRGFGAEFGHMRLPTHELVTDGDVPVCGCGQKACAEAFASLKALDYHPPQGAQGTTQRKPSAAAGPRRTTCASRETPRSRAARRRTRAGIVRLPSSSSRHAFRTACQRARPDPCS